MNNLKLAFALDFERRSLHTRQKAAVGDHIDVEIKGFGEEEPENMRLRIRWREHDLAVLEEGWEFEDGTAKGTLNLNTEGLLRLFARQPDLAEMQLSCVLDAKDVSLIASGTVLLKNWPRPPSEVPVKLDGWSKSLERLMEELNAETQARASADVATRETLEAQIADLEERVATKAALSQGLADTLDEAKEAAQEDLTMTAAELELEWTRADDTILAEAKKYADETTLIYAREYADGKYAEALPKAALDDCPVFTNDDPTLLEVATGLKTLGEFVKSLGTAE